MMRQGFSCGVLAVACVAVCAVAQSPAFEVAAIRLSNDPPFMITGPGLRHGLLTATKVTLRRLITAAYGMTEPRVIGPDWLDQDHFDVAGRSPEGVPDSELRPMLRALLKDRFHLAVHSETREMPVYDLVVAKGGVRMALYPAPERPLDNPAIRGFPMMRGTATTAQLADTMASFVNRPVINKTGLSKRYNYFAAFAPLSPQTGESYRNLARLTFLLPYRSNSG
jgi:uncharacterized protein (TIGR03435 family)